jgi:hypothetical protein
LSGGRWLKAHTPPTETSPSVWRWGASGRTPWTTPRRGNAAVIHGLPKAPTGLDEQRKTAALLAASILGVRCDDDAASAFWSMVAPGVAVDDLSHWFFEGFLYGAAEVFSEATDDEYGELRKLIPHPPPAP